MKVTTTFRHMGHDDKLRSYAEEKIKRIADKYFHRPQEATVILVTEKFRHSAEITLHADNIALAGKDEEDDMKSAIDLALDKIEKQASKHRQKFKVKKRRPSAEREEEVGEGTFTVYRGIPPETSEEGFEPRVIKEDKFEPKPLAVEDAILHLEEVREDFLVFRNSESLKICVLYRRPDGHYGLIEPEE